MLLKDHIKQCQDLYDSYDQDYLNTMGEPVIMIDVFKKDVDEPHLFRYAGISPEIKITHSPDGVYPILTAFIE
jgi:hypothetical protein